jgi:hypothetical protein
MKFIKQLGILAVIAVFTAVKAYPYSFDAYTGMTGNQILSLSPTFSFGSSGIFDPIASYGFSDHFDLFADFADFNLYPGFGYNFSWVMPRYEFIPGNIAALQLQYTGTPSSAAVVPEYQLFLENDYFAIELNADLFIPLSSATNTALTVIAAPVWKVINNLFYFFVEIDPSYSFNQANKASQNFAMNIVPGIWLGIPGTQHQFCLAFTIGDVGSVDISYTFDFWYSVSFELVKQQTNN